MMPSDMHRQLGRDIFASRCVSIPVRFVRNLLVRLGLLHRKYEQEFSDIYVKRYWGKQGSASGSGSSLPSTRVVRAELPRLFQRRDIRSMLDIPCGDFHWMREVPLEGVSYLGADVVAELVRENTRLHSRPGVSFAHLDVINDRLPAVDLVMCRDCLVHLPLADAIKALRNIARSGSRWLLVTTFPSRVANTEIAAGKWRPLDLQIGPFHLPEPDELINEECADADGAYADKSLGLWSCEAIRRAVG